MRPLPELSTVQMLSRLAQQRAVLYGSVALYVLVASAAVIAASFLPLATQPRFFLRFGGGGAGATALMPFLLKYMKWLGVRDVSADFALNLTRAAEDPTAVSRDALIIMATHFWKMYFGIWRA